MKEIKYLLIVIGLLLLLFTWPSNRELANCQFYILVLLAVVELWDTKSMSLSFFWILGFIYMVLSEMLLASYGKEFEWSIKFLLSANYTVLLSYFITSKKIGKKLKNHTIDIIQFKRKKVFFFVLFTLYVIFLIGSYQSALRSLSYGRGLVNVLGGTTLYGAFLQAASHILPSSIAFYIVRIKNQSKWIALLISLPIFIVVFIQATRFRMLFTVVPFLVIANYIKLNQLKFKTIATFIVLILIASITSNFLKANRNNSFYEISFSDIFVSSTEKEDAYFSMRIARNCSPEGVVKMTQLADVYFDSHELTYGKSFSFLFYFWIPRSIWPEKPTQVDYWLPRFFDKNIADTASTSSGFTGELRADFGIFCYFFLIIMGCFLKKANSYLEYYNYGRSASYNSLFAVTTIPMTIFMVRSPVLSLSTSFVSVGILYLMYNLFFKVKNGGGK